jgi:Fe-S-cluster containining protein
MTALGILRRSRRLADRVARVLGRPGGEVVGYLPRLYGWSDRATDRAIQKQGEGAIACSSGCSSCCHLAVPVTGPEAIALAEALDKLEPDRRDRLVGRVITVGRRLAEQPGVNRFVEALPCGFLDGGVCSVYAARPFACRGHHGQTRRGCEAIWETGRWQGRSILAVDWVAHAIAAGLQTHLQRQGRDAQLYELNGAVAAVLEPETRDRARQGHPLPLAPMTPDAIQGDRGAERPHNGPA